MSPNNTEVYREYVPCPLNSSHSFWPILLKLYRGFKDGLKICMWFFQNHEIIFYHYFRIFNVDIFWALILQKCIGNRYLVPSTPPTVFGQSFWNFTEAFRMVWRYACGVFIILKVFLITFSAFLAVLYVELISQGESPASVREYVSTWVRQYVHKHFLVIASPPNFM